MLKVVLSALVTVITSFYFFPFEFAFLPGINTKMAMAGLGLVVAGASIAGRRNAEVNMDFVVILLLAVGISVASLLTIAWNGTNDKSFISYYISVLVWLSAAYVVCRVIGLVHGQGDSRACLRVSDSCVQRPMYHSLGHGLLFPA